MLNIIKMELFGEAQQSCRRVCCSTQLPSSVFDIYSIQRKYGQDMTDKEILYEVS